MSKHRLAKFLIIAFLPPVIGAFFVTWFAFSMQYLWLYIDDFIGKGLAAYEVLKLIFLNAVSLIPLAMPLGVLLGSIITFGNLGEKSELTAVKAAGISIVRFSKPLIIFVFGLTCASFLFNNYVIPKTQLKAFRDYYDIVNKKPALNIKEGIFFKEIPDQTIYIGKKEKDNETIRNVKIFDNSDNNGNTKLVTATSGKMYLTADKRFLIFELNDGWRYEYHDDINAQNFEQTRFKFGFWRKSFDLAFLKKNKTSEDYFKNMNQVMTIFEIQKEIDSSYIQLGKTHKGLGELVQNNFLGLNKKVLPLAHYSSTKTLPIKKDTNVKDTNIENKKVVLNDTKTINRVVAKNKKKNTTIKKVLLNTFLKNVPDTFLSP
nr:LptF/LptG family permease [Chitinophagaceae bacterium]